MLCVLIFIYKNNYFQPLVLTSTPKGIKENVSRRHLRRRTKFLHDQIFTTAGATKLSLLGQTSALVKRFPQAERETILKEAQLSSATITSEAMVALKADMGVPWEKMKTMAR